MNFEIPEALAKTETNVTFGGVYATLRGKQVGMVKNICRKNDVSLENNDLGPNLENS